MDYTYSVFRELRNIVKYKLVWISKHVNVLLVVVWDDTSDYLSFCVLELWVSTEILSFLLICELICHLLLFKSAFLSLFKILIQ
jgi:hypothetical protein